MVSVEYWIVSNKTNTDVHICTLEEFIPVEAITLLSDVITVNCMNRCENCCQLEICHWGISFMSCHRISQITAENRCQLGNSLTLLFIGKLLDAGETVEW